MPKNNRSWWEKKLELNAARDIAIRQELGARGWTMVRVWEHEDSQAAAEMIQSLVLRCRHRTQRAVD